MNLHRIAANEMTLFDFAIVTGTQIAAVCSTLFIVL